ncbi:hypothetical protein PtB15_18B336 [Puccinia triticina]|nr:hypothetical protein PtB15_18B336 [Puccinia triticina]
MHNKQTRGKETKWYAKLIFFSGLSLDGWNKITAAYGGDMSLFRRRFQEELAAVLPPSNVPQAA